MSDNNFRWLGEGIDKAALFSLSDSGVTPLATDDPGGDTCSTYGGCNLYACSSDGSGGCSSDSPSCTSDSTTTWEDDDATVYHLISGTTVDMYLTPLQSRPYARTARFKFGSEIKSANISAYSTSRVSATFSGSYGQTYDAQYAIRVSDGTRTYFNSGSITISWPDDNATVYYTIDGTSVTMTLRPLQSRSYARVARFKFGDSLKSADIPAGSTDAVTATFTGTAGQTYKLEYAIRVASDSTRTFYSTDSLTIEELNYKLINIGTSATYDTVTISFDIQNSPTSTSMSFTFYLEYDGLTSPRSFSATKDPGTTHVDAKFSSVPSATKCTLWIVDNTRKVTSSKYVRRTKNNFSWSTNVAAGAAFNILATDWNEYTSQLKAKLEYYATNGEKTYSPATVAKGDQLTAVKVNNIAAVINWLVDNNKGDCTTKVGAVSAGDPVTAAKINLLATCLNQ